MENDKNEKNEYNKPRRIKDDKDLTGLSVKRTVYRKAWFHEGFQRWDVNKYGEAGTNVPLYAYEDTSLDFFVFNFNKIRARMRLERKKLDSFYYENPQAKIYSFTQFVILVPLSICKPI